MLGLVGGRHEGFECVHQSPVLLWALSTMPLLWGWQAMAVLWCILMTLQVHAQWELVGRHAEASHPVPDEGFLEGLRVKVGKGDRF